MSREFHQHSLIAHDLFDRDGTALYAPGAATNESSAVVNDESADQLTPQLQVRRANISEDLWEEARRRHCAARQNWRSLLDKYVKPHH
ncbi:hypothetical protein DWB84_13585 [Saccharophagus sp. K07]|jgi:hypothetical protein|uniref:hypothetical protein n=1 Tax=Saccharophagus sp. K07 TaxID=2283636 RepID=UPI00165223CA|nr:hypothetical protein [Saccharophagus sp. K07]MBC6906489.1 hypothetical protein [Saccharophagus sp. K07]